jgi:hypothetical protein
MKREIKAEPASDLQPQPQLESPPDVSKEPEAPIEDELSSPSVRAHDLRLRILVDISTHLAEA